MIPELQSIDHVHLYVSDRPAAERWYREVLGFRRVPELDAWTTPNGPLTITNGNGQIHLALFARPPKPNPTTIALNAGGEAFVEWLEHLRAALDEPLEPVDHELAWSLYFKDPDGNPFEITTYDYEQVARRLGRA